jgi:hypothetical protein
VLLIPLFLPPYILAVAWSSVLGKRGLLYKWFGLGEPASAFLHSLSGGATILTFAFLPIAILFIKTALAQVHVEIEEAARLEASRGQVLRRITLPLIAPAMLSSGILIFVLTISEFAVPMFLGRSSRRKSSHNSPRFTSTKPLSLCRCAHRHHTGGNELGAHPTGVVFSPAKKLHHTCRWPRRLEIRGTCILPFGLCRFRHVADGHHLHAITLVAGLSPGFCRG